MKTHYTSLVEHYFRLGARHPEITNPISAHWYSAVWEFFDNLSNEDREFLLTLFGKHADLIPALKSYPGSFSQNLSKLSALEQNFAVRTNII